MPTCPCAIHAMLASTQISTSMMHALHAMQDRPRLNELARALTVRKAPFPQKEILPAVLAASGPSGQCLKNPLGATA